MWNEEKKARMRKFLNWRQILPSIVTLGAMLAGFLSIVSVVSGFQVGMHEANVYYLNAARLIMLAMILDGIDGNLARWIKGTSEFGAELDTYVDMTAFGIAPAILIFAVALRPETPPAIRLLLPSAVALSGVVRLARFKVADPLRGQGGYGGLPITANAGWVALFVFISQVPPTAGRIHDDFFSLQRGWFATVFLVGILIFISLQVSNVRYPKPTKKAAIFIPSAILVFLFVLLPKRYSMWAAVVLLLLGLVYAVAGPMFVKGAEIHKARKERQLSTGSDMASTHRRRRRRRR
ncbi:MAG: CDP-alcohol phosphatidyltransferase family protein [Kiritimatiellia bacterium]